MLFRSLWNSCCCSSRSIARLDSNGTSAPDCTERELQQQLFQSEDAKEGIAANQEKRMAEFKGK